MLMAEEGDELLGFSACGESRDDDAGSLDRARSAASSLRPAAGAGAWGGP